MEDVAPVAATSTEARLSSARAMAGCPLATRQHAGCEHAKAEESVGTVLDRLSWAGARVLHQRHVSVSLGRVGNLVVNHQGIHIVETLAVTDQSRPWIDTNGIPRVGPFGLTHLLNCLSEVATYLEEATYTIMDRASHLPVYKLVATVGGPTGQGFNWQGTDLVSIDLLPLWVSRLTGERDHIDVAAVTAALEQICSNAC